MAASSPQGSEAEPTEVDVVVVGAGGAGMCAALRAAHRGLDVVLLEKSEYFGGSTARSGGGVWIPGNYVLRAARQFDTPDAAKLYLDSIIGDSAPKQNRDTYIERGPEVMEFLRDSAPVRFSWVPEYADYHPEAPGGRPRGRSVEPDPLDGNILGEELDRLHPPYAKQPPNVIVTQATFRKISLGARTRRGPAAGVKVIAKALLATARKKRMYAMGNALAIGLRKGLMDARVPVHYGQDLTELVIEDGRVAGVRTDHGGTTTMWRARRGVVLASGGFERNPELREKHQPTPATIDWTTGSKNNTGAGLLAGIAAGADTALLDDAWWGPSIPLPGGPWFALAERNLPGSIIVNGAGRRYMNEALPYVEAVHEMHRGHATGVPHVPSYLVFDQRYRNRYIFAGLMPRQRFPGRWYKNGAVTRADSLAELARRIDVSPEALTSTVERFNGFAESGRDEDFGRGESMYDRYYSDPTVRPNPSLHRIDQGPFYAVRIVPGDLGTKGGLRTDERARVLRPDGSAIPGLYAAGNASAAVMGRTYAGPGATIGPALTFGYLAAEDLATGDAATEKGAS